MNEPKIDILDFREDCDERWPYTLRCYELADWFGSTFDGVYRDNYGAQDKVREHLEADNPDLSSHVAFDSEMGCFFAYADSAEAAVDLRAAILRLLGLEVTPAVIET